MGSFGTFGPFEIIRKLGVGGMAETFVALRRGPGGFEQRVCLKRVLPAFSGDPDFVRLFMQEAQIAAALRHSNVVGVIDFGVWEDAHFMALELVDGADLRTVLGAQQTRRLPPALVAMIGAELAAGLGAAHGHVRRGQRETIVHRDVSPSNILISYAGEVKLTDFGIAKAVDRAGAAVSRTVKGKIPYMSPEQACGDRLDGRSDIFSLGVVLYEALCGVRPFGGESEVQTMQQILEGRREPVVSRMPEAPAALASLIEQMLQLKPDDRPHDADAVLAALASIAPPLTARRELGAIVKVVKPPPVTESGIEHPRLAMASGSAATALASARAARTGPPRTEAIDPQPLNTASAVQVGAPGDETRTRAAAARDIAPANDGSGGGPDASAHQTPDPAPKSGDVPVFPIPRSSSPTAVSGTQTSAAATNQANATEDTALPADAPKTSPLPLDSAHSSIPPHPEAPRSNAAYTATQIAGASQPPITPSAERAESTNTVIAANSTETDSMGAPAKSERPPRGPIQHHPLGSPDDRAPSADGNEQGATTASYSARPQPVPIPATIYTDPPASPRRRVFWAAAVVAVAAAAVGVVVASGRGKLSATNDTASSSPATDSTDSTDRDLSAPSQPVVDSPRSGSPDSNPTATSADDPTGDNPDLTDDTPGLAVADPSADETGKLPGAAGAPAVPDRRDSRQSASKSSTSKSSSSKSAARSSSSTRRTPRSGSKKARRGTSTLRVSVLPFGQVWLKGRRVGRAPVTLELPAGRHRVEVGRWEPTTHRTVEIKPGEDRRLVVQLVDPAQ